MGNSGQITCFVDLVINKYIHPPITNYSGIIIASHLIRIPAHFSVMRGHHLAIPVSLAHPHMTQKAKTVKMYHFETYSFSPACEDGSGLPISSTRFSGSDSDSN